MNLQQAINLRKSGRSIIPLGRDKRPDLKLCPYWKKYQTEYFPDEIIVSWFKGFNGEELNRNIGIITGKISGITVIDVDNHGGQELCDENLAKFPETFTVKTGSGGYHLYYKYSEKTASSSDQVEHIEIKNDGGYVVSPFSEIDDTYDEAGVFKKKGGFYKVIKPLPFSDYPETTSVFKEVKRFDKTTLVEVTPSGGRNNQLTAVIGHWLAITPKKLWDTVLPMAQLWNKEKCDPPMSEYEVGTIFRSIYVRESKKERMIDKEYDEESIEVEIVKLFESAEEHLKSLSGEKIPTGIAKLDEVLEGGLRLEHLAVISGYTGEGKSLLAMYLTKHMLNNQVPVLWFQFEMPPSEFWDKYVQLGITKEAPLYVPKVHKTATMDWVEEVIIKSLDLGVKVVVFDLLDYLQTGLNRKVNKNDEDSEIIMKLKRLASKYKIAIVLMAHARKPSGGEERMPTLYDIRGTGNITGIANWVLLVYRIKYKKSKGEFVEEDQTKYSQFSLQKNRINGKECNFYSFYENGEMVMVSPTEAKDASTSSPELEAFTKKLS